MTRQPERCKYCDTDQIEPDTGICHRCFDTEWDAIAAAVEEERERCVSYLRGMSDALSMASSEGPDALVCVAGDVERGEHWRSPSLD